MGSEGTCSFPDRSSGFTGTTTFSPSENAETSHVKFDVEPELWNCFDRPASPTNALDRLAVNVEHSWKLIDTQI